MEIHKLFFIILIMPSAGHAGLFRDIQDSVTDVAEKVESIDVVSKQAIDRAADDEARALAAEKQLQETVEEYEELTRDIVDKAGQIDEQRIELEKEKAELVAEKKRLEAEKSILQNDKAALEKSKEIYSTGLFASLGAIFLGAIGYFGRRPLVKLEIKLKELEIAEKEALLEKMC